jgi:nicotinate-nucleotide adenylyltransferase
MNVGIFGGAFDPPHLAHLVVAETARDQFDLERVLWIPSRIPPHKEHPQATPEERLAMTRRAIDDHAAFFVSDLELTREGGPSYTVETVRQLQDDHPDASYVLILGEDSLHGFHSWRAPDEIARRVSLVAYERGACDDEERAADPFVRQAAFVDAPRIELSSTKVRERCRAGRSVRYLVPSSVDAYIQEHGLYGAADRKPQTADGGSPG